MNTEIRTEVKKELKKIVKQLKTAQEQFHGLIKDRTWIEDARKYAESQGKEIKKLISGDLGKVRAFIDKERKELDRFQKQIPAEIQKFKAYVGDQRKELEKLLKSVRKASSATGAGKKKTVRKAATGTRKKKTASPAAVAKTVNVEAVDHTTVN